MKELWVYAEPSTFPDEDLALLRAQYPTLTIRRASIDNGFWWRPTDTTDPFYVPHKSGTGTDFGATIRDNFFVPELSGWASPGSSIVDHGILQAAVNQTIGSSFGGDVHISDIEPSIKFLLKTDNTYSDAVKQQMIEGYMELREVIRAAKPSFIDVTTYNITLQISGRRAPTENAGASRAVAWAIDQGLTGTDNTPIFNELSWYPSNRDWADIIADFDANIDFAVQYSDLDPVTHLTAVLYADSRMLDPADPRLPVASQGLTGGLNYFKAWADAVASRAPADKKLVAITRRYVTRGAMQNDISSEIPHEETWFKGMAQYFAESQYYDVVAHYASGGSPDANLGNGTTFRQQLQWLADAMVAANQAALVTTPATTPTSAVSNLSSVTEETVLSPLQIFGPNWSNEVKITTTFKTSQSVNAENQRIRRLLAKRPQRSINYEFLESGYDDGARRRHDILLAGLARGLEALWPDIMPCANVGSADFSVTTQAGFDPTKYRYFVGQKVMIGSISDKRQVIERTITAINSTSVSFTPAAGENINNAVIVPCMLCDIVQTSRFNAITARTASGTLNRSEVVGASCLPARITPGVNPPGFSVVNDIPALLPSHNYAQDLDIGIDRGYTSTDLGIDQHRNYVGDIPLLNYRIAFSSDNRDAINEMVGFFESRGGSVYPFWFLDPLDDFTVFATAGASVIVGPSTVDGGSVLSGLEKIDFLLRPDIYIFDTSGNLYIRKVQSASRVATAWNLTLTTDTLPNLTESQIGKAGFAVLAHFSDSMEESWARTGVASVSFEINQSEGQPTLDIANFPLLNATDLDIRWTVSYCDPPTCEELGGLPVAPDCCFFEADRLRVMSNRRVNDLSGGGWVVYEIPETILDPLLADSDYPAGRWSWEGTVETKTTTYNSSGSVVSTSSINKTLRIVCDVTATQWTINFVGSSGGEITTFLFCDGPLAGSSSVDTYQFGSLCDQFSNINCQSYTDRADGDKTCSGNAGCAGITYSEEYDDPDFSETSGTWSTLILRTV